MNKTISKNQSGFSSVLIVVIVAVLAIGGYTAYKWSSSSKTAEDSKMMEKDEMMQKDDAMMDKTSSPAPDAMMEDKMMKDEGMMEGDSMMLNFSGKVLAGKSSPLLVFSKADYDIAVKSDKLIVLYFYANWCPICRAEFPKMEEAFNELNTDKVIGFQVNYKDDETDDNEKDLAREHGVAYQHTKVFIKNGQRIGKYPDSWDKARYLNEINKALGQ